MSNIVFAKVGTPEPPEFGFTKLFATESGIGGASQAATSASVGGSGGGGGGMARRDRVTRVATESVVHTCHPAPEQVAAAVAQVKPVRVLQILPPGKVVMGLFPT